MEMAYVTLLASDSFLPGVLALNQSLKIQLAKHDLFVMVTPNISPGTLAVLENCSILFIEIEQIPNPHVLDTAHPYYAVFDKLAVYNLTTFKKVIYLDSDTLVINNIDSLFDAPAGSAINSGGTLPSFRHWKQLNSGVLVVEPNIQLFNSMISVIETYPSSDQGDQGFLHSFFPDWVNQKHLHLDQGYNMFSGFLNMFNKIYGYDFISVNVEKLIYVVHFWTKHKPWLKGRESIKMFSGLEAKANLYWWEMYDGINSKIL